MDELDLFRDFRSGAPAASEDARRRALTRLRRTIADEQARGTSGLRLIGKRRYAAVACAALAAVVSAALFLSSPWSNTPGLLQRAQAALAPRAGVVAHYKWELTSTSNDPACNAERLSNEMWIDQAPPRRYRSVTTPLVLKATSADFYFERTEAACSIGAPSEEGGDVDSGQTLRFVPPSTLAVGSPIVPEQIPSDPVSELREALAKGTAHAEGRTQLEGRTVERIRIDPPRCPTYSSFCPRGSSYAFVDPETFALVRRENRYELALPDGRVVQLLIALRFLAFEHLPRTPANLALTDIQAQHPNATRP